MYLDQITPGILDGAYYDMLCILEFYNVVPVMLDGGNGDGTVISVANG